MLNFLTPLISLISGNYIRGILFIGILGIAGTGFYNWHYKPLKEFKSQLEISQKKIKDQKNIILDRDYEIRIIRKNIKTLKSELDVCRMEVELFRENEPSNIKDTEQDGYFIY
jgi:hypothetical protein